MDRFKIYLKVEMKISEILGKVELLRSKYLIVEIKTSVVS